MTHCPRKNQFDQRAIPRATAGQKEHAHSPTVLHIEDDALWSEVTAHLLKEWTDIRQIGTAANGHQGLAICSAAQPDIVLLDLGLPDMDGLAVLDRLTKLPHPPQIVVLTKRRTEALIYQLSFLRIVSLIWKSGAFAPDLRLALTAAIARQRYLPDEVREETRRLSRDPEAFSKILSPREINLVCLMAQGFSDSEIADKTGCAHGTIRNHRHNIVCKLGLRDKFELVRWAESKGFRLNTPRCES